MFPMCRAAVARAAHPMAQQRNRLCGAALGAVAIQGGVKDGVGLQRWDKAVVDDAGEQLVEALGDTDGSVVAADKWVTSFVDDRELGDFPSRGNTRKPEAGVDDGEECCEDWCCLEYRVGGCV